MSLDLNAHIYALMRTTKAWLVPIPRYEIVLFKTKFIHLFTRICCSLPSQFHTSGAPDLSTSTLPTTHSPENPNPHLNIGKTTPGPNTNGIIVSIPPKKRINLPHLLSNPHPRTHLQNARLRRRSALRSPRKRR